MISVRSMLARKFANKEYRDAFVAEQIFSRLPLKIRGIREQQDLTQCELGNLAGMAQTWVSKLEDPNYGKLTIATLLKLASAFDVALQIDFVPFSRVLDDSLRLSRESFTVPQFRDDAGLSGSHDVNAGASITINLAGHGTLIAFPSYASSVIRADVPVPPKSVPSAAQQQAIA